MSLTTCVKWIGKGSRGASVPRKEDLYDRDLVHMAAAAAAPATDASDQASRPTAEQKAASANRLLRAVQATDNEEDLLNEMMRGYDSDDEEEPATGHKKTAQADVAQGVDDDDDDNGTLPGFSSDITFYRDNSEDPFLTGKRRGGAAPGGDDDDQDSDFDDLVLRPDDLLLCTAHTEEDGEWSHIDYEVVEPSEKFNNYVHHDLVAPAFPLCLEWVDWRPGHGPVVQHRRPYNDEDDDDDSGDDDDDDEFERQVAARGMRPGEQGANLLAVGSFEPGIEIWDLDVLDALEPVAVLGGVMQGGQQQSQSSGGLKGPQQRRGRPSSNQLLQGSHEDAVLGLSANRLTRQLLASASADKTVRVWDLQQGSLAATLAHHTDKVQSVAWHPREAPVLLSGSYDRTAAVVDVRAAASGAQQTFRLPGDCEALVWDPHSSERFFVATDTGRVCAFNAVGGDAVVSWQVGDAEGAANAGDGAAVSALAMHPGTAGILATASLDGRWSLWDVADSSRRPRLLHQADLEDPLFAMEFCADFPSLLAIVGRGIKRIIDVDQLPAMQNHRSSKKRGQDRDGDDDEDRYRDRDHDADDVVVADASPSPVVSAPSASPTTTSSGKKNKKNKKNNKKKKK